MIFKSLKHIVHDKRMNVYLYSFTRNIVSGGGALFHADCPELSLFKTMK